MYSAAPAGSHRHVRWGILPAALYKRQADRGRDRKVAIRWERYEARPNSARYNCSGPSPEGERSAFSPGRPRHAGKTEDKWFALCSCCRSQKKTYFMAYFFYTFTAKVFNLEHGRKLWRHYRNVHGGFLQREKPAAPDVFGISKSKFKCLAFWESIGAYSLPKKSACRDT